MIPKDPMILLSYVNTQLRDYYDSLEALCTCRGLKKDELVAKMHSIDYEYDEATNQLGSIFRIAYKKAPCFNCPKVINCGAVIGSCVSKSVQF